MVSTLRKASVFYELQKKGKIARPYKDIQKLQKDKEGFYLNKRNKIGEVYKQRVKSDDLVYTRQEGVTKYTYLNDKNHKIPDTIHKATGQEHYKYKHISDREAFSTSRRYKE